MKHFKILPTLLLIASILLTFNGCDEETDSPTDPTDDPDVTSPTNLVAASADKALLLEWTASVSESASNFGTYSLTVFNQSTNTSQEIAIAKGTTKARVDGLSNGTRYLLTLRAVTTKGKKSSGFAQIEWSPAVRQNTDASNQVIKVYATTSANNSAIDFYNSAGKAEVIPQSGQEFKDRGDAYVFATSSSTTYLEIKSPDQASNKGLETQFSTVSANVDNLDDHLQASMPSAGTFSTKIIRIDDGSYTTGKVYFGRLVRGTDFYYFRLLVKRGAANNLIQGSGNDRFLEMVVSFQNSPNVPFAKR